MKDNPQPGDITQIQINNAQTSISARVYYFIVTDTTTFPHCNPTSGNTGLFNIPSAFTYTYTYPATYPANPTPPPSIALSEPSTTFVSGKTFPASGPSPRSARVRPTARSTSRRSTSTRSR